MVAESDMTEDQKVAARLVWRLEILQYRGRYTSEGEYVRLPTRVRRFSNALPIGKIADVIEALVSLAPYKDVVLFNGEKYGSDVEYRPTSTYIKKDDTLKTGTQDRGSYTIVQDLLLKGTGDIFGVADGSSCSQVSDVELHWDESSIADCPDGSQGITYQIADIQRDKDTDLFSYKIRKVQAVTQHMFEHVASDSDEEMKTLETWDNVYGEPGDFRKDDVVNGGVAIVVPDPEDYGQGEHIEVQVTENDDCTFKIQVVRTLSHEELGAEYSRYRDQFVMRDIDLDSHARAALSKTGVDFSGGVKTTYESKDNPDGTFENKVTVETERPVSDSIVEYRKTLRGFIQSITDRNQAAGVSPTGMVIGETRSSKRTEGGLFDNVVTKPVIEPIGEIATDCQQTIFEHQHSTTENVATKPAAEADTASGGVIHKKTVRATEEGTFDVTDATTTEQAVRDSAVTKRKTLRGVTETHTDRNTTDGAIPATLSFGEEYQVEKTPGGLYNKVHKTVSAESVGEIAALTSKSKHVTVSSTTENRSTNPGSSVDSPSTNVEHTKTVRATEEGTFDVEDKTTTYTEAEAQATTKWATETIVTTSKRHSETKTVQPSGTYGESSAAPDDAGAATTQTVEYTPITVDSDWIEWDSETKTPTQILTYECGLRVFKNMDEATFKGIRTTLSSKKCQVTVSASINKFGMYDGSINYSKLKSWETNPSSESGGSLATGHAYGPVYLLGGKKYRMKYETRVKQGSGWTPQDAADAQNILRAGPYTVLWMNGQPEAVNE